MKYFILLSVPQVCPEEYRRLRQGRKRKSTVLPEAVERCESCTRCSCKGTGCAICGDCCGQGRGLAGDDKGLQASHYFPCKVCGRYVMSVKRVYFCKIISSKIAGRNCFFDAWRYVWRLKMV